MCHSEQHDEIMYVPLWAAGDMNYRPVQRVHLCMFPTRWSLSGHLSDQIDCHKMAGLVIKSPLLYLITALKAIHITFITVHYYN